MWTETTLRFHLTTVKDAEKRALFPAGQSVDWRSHCGNQCRGFSQMKQNYPSAPLWQGDSASCQRNTCTSTGNELEMKPASMPFRWWMNYENAVIKAMQFYPTTKKTGVVPFTGKWMELKSIGSSKVTLGPERETLHALSHVWLLAFNCYVCVLVGHEWG